MEGRRDDDVAGAVWQGWYSYGGGSDESDGSSSGVELSLCLRTGSSPPTAAVEEQQDQAAARRTMSILYGGRVCAVDVTEIQAREIISMANQEIMAQQRRLQQQQHREYRHVQNRASSSSGSGAARCGGQARPAGAALSPSLPLSGLAATAAPVTDQAGMSMKRSLQRFLQKREAGRLRRRGTDVVS